MYCPIQNMNTSTGRVTTTLQERTHAVNAAVKVHENYRQGRIDIGDATRQLNQISRTNWPK